MMKRFSSESFRWTADQDGRWLCIKCSQPKNILDGLQSGKPYDVEIKEHRERRSLDANAYFWTLVGKLSAAVGTTPEHIYRECVRNIGDNNEIVCVPERAAKKIKRIWERNGLGWQAEEFPSKIEGCVNFRLFYGSSVYDTAQMSRLIDNIVQDCKAVGIETLPPEKLEAMKKEWDA